MGLFGKKPKRPKDGEEAENTQQLQDKPVKQAKQKPVKEKSVKQKAVKQKPEKPVKQKGKKGQPIEQPPMQEQMQDGMQEQQYNLDFDPNIPIPAVPIPDMQPEQFPMQNDIQMDTSNLLVSNMMQQMQHELTTDWRELARTTTVRSSGIVTTLEGYCAAFRDAAKQGRQDGLSLKINFGKVVSLLINNANPGFLTSISRIVDGRVDLIKVCKPFDAREASYGEYRVYVDYIDEALKYNLLMVGVFKSGRPFVTEGSLDTTDNRLVGRFPEVPAVIAIMAIIPN